MNDLHAAIMGNKLEKCHKLYVPKGNKDGTKVELEGFRVLTEWRSKA